LNVAGFREKFLFQTNLLSILFLSAVIALILPVSSGPDDDFHLSSIWCSHGVSINCEEQPSTGNGFKASVEDSLAQLIMCKGRDPSVPTICENVSDSTGYSQIRSNEGRYPGFYYWLSGLMIFSSPLISVLLMRIFLIFICLSYIALGMWMLGSEARKKFLIVNTLLFIPLPLFFLGTNNPQVISLVIYPMIITILLEYLRSGGNNFKFKNIILISWVGLGCLLMMGSRPDGFLYAIFGIFFVSISHFLQNRSCKPPTFYAFFGLAFTLLTFQIIFFQTKLGTNFNQMSSNRNGHFLQILLENPSFLLGLLGGRGDSGYLSLGSYDIPLPSMVSLPLLISWVMILTRNIRGKKIRQSFILTTIATLVIEFYGMYRNYANTEGFFQPRYIYIFLITGVVIYLMGSKEDKLEIPTFAFFLHFWAGISLFFVLILRNSSGIRVRQSDYLSHYAGPSGYVSKPIIHWNYFGDRVHGIFSIDSMGAFIFLSCVWLIATATVAIVSGKNRF